MQHRPTDGDPAPGWLGSLDCSSQLYFYRSGKDVTELLSCFQRPGSSQLFSWPGTVDVTGNISVTTNAATPRLWPVRRSGRFFAHGTAANKGGTGLSPVPRIYKLMLCQLPALLHSTSQFFPNLSRKVPMMPKNISCSGCSTVPPSDRRLNICRASCSSVKMSAI